MKQVSDFFFRGATPNYCFLWTEINFFFRVTVLYLLCMWLHLLYTCIHYIVHILLYISFISYTEDTNVHILYIVHASASWYILDPM
jgi:hypothetical protein